MSSPSTTGRLSAADPSGSGRTGARDHRAPAAPADGRRAAPDRLPPDLAPPAPASPVTWSPAPDDARDRNAQTPDARHLSTQDPEAPEPEPPDPATGLPTSALLAPELPDLTSTGPIPTGPSGWPRPAPVVPPPLAPLPPRPRGAHAARPAPDSTGPRPPRMLDVLRRMSPLLRAHRLGMAFGILAAIAGTACDTASIRVFSYVTDHVLAVGRPSALVRPGALWLGLSVAGAALGYAGSITAARIAQTVLLRLRDQVMSHAQRLSPDFYDRSATGDLLARFTSDLGSLASVLTSMPARLVTTVAGIVLFAGAALWTRWDLALLCFAIAPLFWLSAGLLGDRIRRLSTAERTANGKLTAAVQESIATMRLVQVYSQEEAVGTHIHLRGAAWRRAALNQLRVSALFGPITQVIEAAAVLTVVGVGAWEIGAHRLTLGGLLSFAAFLGYLYPQVQGLGSLRVSVAQATAAAGRIYELLDTRPTVVDPGQGAAAPPRGPRRSAGDRNAARAQAPARTSPRTPVPGADPPAAAPGTTQSVVALEGVSFRYPGADRPVLRDLSHTARPGRLVLLDGPSGSGKSTLAALLVRWYDPTEGRILLDGRDIRDIPLRELRARITLMPQETQVIRGTVAQNIAFGRPGATPEEILRAARTADLDGFVSRLPLGYHTQIGTNGRFLSGGQLRRLAIARALLRDSPVLVLDEPTTGLDARTTDRLIAPLRHLMAHRTTYLITHDPRLAAQADEVLPVSAREPAAS